MSRIAELRARQAALVAEARERLDQITPATDEARAAELTASHDAAMAEYDRLGAVVEREQRLADLETRAQDDRRPTEDRSARPAAPVDAEARHRAAFANLLRHGREGLSAEERALVRPTEDRALSAVASTGGAYTIPAGFQAELVLSMKAYGPMNDAAIVRELVTASGAVLPFPTLDDTSNKGRRIAENTQVSAANLTFGAKNLNAYKYTTDVVQVPSELLQDSGLNIEQIVRDAMAERLGRILNDDLTTGTGTSQPTGIVTGAGAGATAAAASALVLDDLLNLQHSVDPAYRDAPTTRWQFNDATLKVLRKLKDGDGMYLWQDSSAAGTVPATLLGKPYSINQSMADVGTGNKSVLFGDISKYIVRRVRDFTLARLTERYADYDQVGFIGFARYDGALLDVGAVKVLTHP